MIEQAKGMVMQAHGMSADEAFATLRAESQYTNRKLRDVALELAEGRTLVASLAPRVTRPS